MKILNDCSNYHAGSYLVMHQIREHLKYLNENEKKQILIINGEGTFHNNAKRALELIEEINTGKEKNKIIFLNSVWQNMAKSINNLHLACLRESFSENEFKLLHPNTPTQVIADITLTYEYSNNHSRNNNILVFDSVSPQISAYLKKVSKIINADFVEMCKLKLSYGEILNLIGSSKAIISGRYHGVMFAAITNTPFLAAPSNTWKTQGFMNDINQLDFFCENEDRIIDLVRLNEFGNVPTEFIINTKNKWKNFFKGINNIDF